MTNVEGALVVAAIGLAVGFAGHLGASHEERKRGGWAMSLGLGTLGATAGGALGDAWWVAGHGVKGGIVLFAFVGAVFLVAIYHILTSRRPLLR